MTNEETKNGNLKIRTAFSILGIMVVILGSVIGFVISNQGAVQEVNINQGERISTLEANVINIQKDVSETNEVVKNIYELLIKNGK